MGDLDGSNVVSGFGLGLGFLKGLAFMSSLLGFIYVMGLG